MERITAEAYELYVGVDVGAESLSMAYGATKQTIGSAETIRQSKAGYAQMMRKLRATGCPANKVRVVMDSTFPLAKAADAHRRLESGAHVGKVVLVV